VSTCMLAGGSRLQRSRARCGAAGALRPRLIISGHQSHQRSSEVISGHQWSAMVSYGHKWPSESSESSVVISGHQCSSPDALLPIGTVAAAPPDLPPVEMQSRRELRTSPDDGAADGLRHCPPPAAAKAVHTYSDVLRCHPVAIQSQSSAIQSQSSRNPVAISGHQCPSPAPPPSSSHSQTARGPSGQAAGS
jgi:hypothetical protein